MEAGPQSNQIGGTALRSLSLATTTDSHEATQRQERQRHRLGDIRLAGRRGRCRSLTEFEFTLRPYITIGDEIVSSRDERAVRTVGNVRCDGHAVIVGEIAGAPVAITISASSPSHVHSEIG